MLGIEADGLKDLSRDLRRASKDGSRLFRGALRKAGDIVRDEARARAGGVSSRIASSIRTGVTQRGVYVRAGDSNAPHAAPFEAGNAPRGRATWKPASSFRHPVFGNRKVWVTQDTHPYLIPAFEGREERVLDVLMEALDDMLGEAGFH